MTSTNYGSQPRVTKPRVSSKPQTPQTYIIQSNCKPVAKPVEKMAQEVRNSPEYKRVFAKLKQEGEQRQRDITALAKKEGIELPKDGEDITPTDIENIRKLHNILNKREETASAM
jgi:hypothetical protein